MRTRRYTSGEIAARREYYVDHDKRLEDAMTAQFGIIDEKYHADGVHPLSDEE